MTHYDHYGETMGQHTRLQERFEEQGRGVTPSDQEQIKTEPLGTRFRLATAARHAPGLIGGPVLPRCAHHPLARVPQCFGFHSEATAEDRR